MVTQGKRPLSGTARGTVIRRVGVTKDDVKPSKRMRYDSPEPEPVHATPITMKMTTPLGPPPHRPLNPIPRSEEHYRPCQQLLIFGNGDMGQLGLGTLVLDVITRPRMHAWFESVSQDDLLGAEVGAGVECVCTGGMHSLVIDELGRVWSWGINDLGTLGRPTVGVLDPDMPGQEVPEDILESQPMLVQTLVDDRFRAVRVAAGDSVSVALSENGQLKVWGSFRASDGHLGFSSSDLTPTPQFRPTALRTLDRLTFASVACGVDHVIALSTQGTVYVWGNGQQAQLGRKIIERRKVNGLVPERLALRRITYIAAGSYHSFAVDENGIVYAWGLNNLRQTGVDEDLGGQEDIVWSPTEVTALNPARIGGRKVVQISGGEHHTLFLLSDGTVFGCGRCDGFELGLASDHPSMVNTVGDDGHNEKKANANTFTCATYISTPIQIPFPPPPTPSSLDPPLPSQAHLAPPYNPIARISAGTRHYLAVSRAGHVYSWGLGLSGQLGLGGDVKAQETPRRIGGKILDELREGEGGVGGFVWRVEDACAGGQHCILVVRRV